MYLLQRSAANIILIGRGLKLFGMQDAEAVGDAYDMDDLDDEWKELLCQIDARLMAVSACNSCNEMPLLCTLSCLCCMALSLTIARSWSLRNCEGQGESSSAKQLKVGNNRALHWSRLLDVHKLQPSCRGGRHAAEQRVHAHCRMASRL